MNKTIIRNPLCAVTAAVLLSILTGCGKDNDGLVSLEITADRYAGSGKVIIDSDRYTCWSHDDAVHVNGDTKTISISGNTCRISDVAQNSSYTAFFPAGLATESTSTSGNLIANLHLSATQTYATDNDGRQKVPAVMAAYLSASTGSLNFHNACIAMKLNLCNNYSRTLRIGSVTVSDNQAPLSGSFNITGVTDNTPSLVYTGTTVSADDRCVTLQINEGITLQSGDNATLYVILPPTDGYNGNKFTIQVTANDEADILSGQAVTVYEFSHTQSDNASGVFPRNTMVPVNINLDEPHTMVLKGIGTTNNPYKIYTSLDLRSMQHLVNNGYIPIGNGQPFASACYRLMDNIDDIATASDMLQPIGTAANNFTGHFDGANHTLTGIYTQTGLFGYVCNATIANLVVNNATVDMTNSSVAGVVCAHADRSVIDSCRVMGSINFVNLPARAAYMGGIVGEAVAQTNDNSYVQNCHCGATVTLSSGNPPHRVGGIVGHLLNSYVLNSYTKVFDNASTNPVMTVGNAYAGGIAGRCDGGSYIVNCYFGIHDSFNGAEGHTADLCGEISSTTHITHCFYLNRIHAIGTPSGDNINSVYSFGLVDGTSQYTHNGQHISTLLNATAATMSLMGWQSQSSPSVAPELAYPSVNP